MEEDGKGETREPKTKREVRLHLKKEEKRKMRQQQLLLLLQEPTIDWRAVEEFMYGENLTPNHMEPGSRVCTSHLAAYAGEAEVLRWCLREKADVDARTSLGRAVLHFACDGNKPRCIRLLLEYGADANMRTLSQMTPLHFCCMYNSYEAVMVLLHDKSQIIDVDAENAKRQIPETLARDRRICRAVRKYRNSLDERRRTHLLEQCLRRLFNVFDRDTNDYILPEEWADTQALMAQHFQNLRQDTLDSVFQAADKNQDGRIDWEEFKTGHKEIMEALGLPFREVLNRLNDIETCVYKERIRLEDLEGDQAKIPLSPVLSERARLLARKRTVERPPSAIGGLFEE